MAAVAKSNVVELRPARTRALVDPSWMALGQAHDLTQAIVILERDGYTVCAFGADCTRVVPVVWVVDHPRLRHLAAEGLADYAEQGTDADGDWRVGGFTRMGVSVRWFERGGR